MSSHHFVREDQEPALLVLAFDSERDRPTVEQLLEWSPRVFAYPDLAEALLLAGYKVDTIISPGEEEGSLASRLQEEQGHITLLPTTSDKADYSFIRQLEVKSLNIYKPDPERLLKALGGGSLVHAGCESLAFYWPAAKGTMLSSGTFRKWMVKDTMVEVAGNELNEVHTSNLTDGMDRQRGLFAESRMYRVEKDGLITIQTDGQRVIICEHI